MGKYVKLIIGFLALYVLFTFLLPGVLHELQPAKYRETLENEEYETDALFYSESPYALETYYERRKKKSD